MSESTNSETGGTKRRLPRWVWIVLVLSLALNLVTIGAIGGKLYAGRHDGFWGGHRHSSDGRAFMRSLSAERREALKKIFREHRKNLKPYWRRARSARREAADVLREESFDKAKFEAALAKLHKSHLEARAASRPMIVDLAGKLNPEERKVFLKTMRHRFFGFGRRRGYRRRHSDDDTPRDGRSEEDKPKPE